MHPLLHIRDIDIYTTHSAGLFTIAWFGKDKSTDCIGIHVFPKRYKGWDWGYSESWYDGPIYTFGFGPLLLICWSFNPTVKEEDNVKEEESSSPEGPSQEA